MSENHFRSHFWPFQIDTQLYFFENFDKMAAVGHFGCPKFTLDHISGHFRSIEIFYFIFTKWLPVALLDVRKSLSISFLSISHRYATFFEIFDKMADVGHFGCSNFTFARISGYFRSIRNFFFLNFLTKWLTSTILDVRNSLSIAFWPFQIDMELSFFF